MGTIIIELYPEQAPLTVNNFLRYVVEDRFANSCFYRVVRTDNQPDNKIKIAVIQGGLQVDEHPLMLPPIPHESTQQTGLRHADGTLSMARNEPGTASSEFSICVGEQPELDFGGKRRKRRWRRLRRLWKSDRGAGCGAENSSKPGEGTNA